MNKYIVIYRGPLERARIAFILEALSKEGKKISFYWIYPGALTEDKRIAFDKFVKVYPLLDKDVFSEKASGVLGILSKLKKLFRADVDYKPVLIGFSTPLYRHSIKGKYLWFINGIPEEEELSTSLLNKLSTRLKWALVKFLDDSDKIVTVSERMNRYVLSRLPLKRIKAIPTCVDLATFNKPEVLKKSYMVYLGSGAKWQAIERTAKVWKELYELDRNIYFRVISRDERTRELAAGIPKTNIEFVSSDDFNVVANYLNECSVGFLIREDILVNRVSFPTKLGEYLSSGCAVISTNIDWDIRDYIDKYKVGTLLDLDISPTEMANKILDFLKSMDKSEIKMNIEKCVAVLDRSYWSTQLNKFLYEEKNIGINP